MPKVTVQIDPSACILAAMCVGIEPKLFQIDQETHVELVNPSGSSQGIKYTFDSTETEREMIQQAVKSCPTQAISMQTTSRLSFPSQSSVNSPTSSQATGSTRLTQFARRIPKPFAR